MMKRLQAELDYINPSTGSVASGLEWVGDFEAREDDSMTWEQWGGESLIEVIRDSNSGEWIENEQNNFK